MASSFALPPEEGHDPHQGETIASPWLGFILLSN